MGFTNEFKKFIARGNVMDMAVGVVIGGAFKGIVDSLVADIINPVIAFCTTGISKLTQSAASVAGADSDAVTKAMDMSRWVVPGTNINVGNFVSSVINFLIMALVVFCMIKLVNKVHTTLVKEEEKEEAPKGPTQEELLTQIRDLLRENKED